LGYYLEEVTRDGRKLDNKELHNFLSSTNNIMMLKSRRMSWRGM
jgi:hypothetical protein